MGRIRLAYTYRKFRTGAWIIHFKDYYSAPAHAHASQGMTSPVDIGSNFAENGAYELHRTNRLARGKQRPPIIVIDEIQKVPTLMDGVQDLIDRKRARFVLCASSARKLKRGAGTNLLPGRVVQVRLDPFMLNEDSARSIESRLCDGDLPGIALLSSAQDRDTDLGAYVTTYLEEEVRAESGQISNFRRLSHDIGIAHTTISDYYDILVDCLIAERVEPYTRSSTRKKLTRSPRMLFFDLGVRRVAANEGRRPPREKLGLWFEQWVGLELIRATRLRTARHPLRFWRDPDGPEVDWVLDMEDRLVPIECKWTDAPTSSDTRHLATFLQEYRQAPRGYVVCRAPRRMSLAPNIDAVPWQELHTVIP